MYYSPNAHPRDKVFSLRKQHFNSQADTHVMISGATIIILQRAIRITESRHCPANCELRTAN
jgi:hypothetical protein